MHKTMKVDILSGDHWASDDVSYKQLLLSLLHYFKDFHLCKCSTMHYWTSHLNLEVSWRCRYMPPQTLGRTPRHGFCINTKCSKAHISNFAIVIALRRGIYVSTIHNVECMYCTKKAESHCIVYTYYPVFSGYHLWCIGVTSAWLGHIYQQHCYLYKKTKLCSYILNHMHQGAWLTSNYVT